MAMDAEGAIVIAASEALTGRMAILSDRFHGIATMTESLARMNVNRWRFPER